MDASPSRSWVRAAFLVGVAYLLIGRLFALPRHHVQFWRLAAWAASAAVYAAHLWYEHVGMRRSTRIAAWHAAVAVAIGALALAIAGMIHSLSTTSTIRPAWLLALVVWPLVTAVPAFLVAFAAGAILARLRRAG